MRLAAQRKDWPTFALPPDRGALTAADVLAHAPGPARDAVLDMWCASVWAAYHDAHRSVAELLRTQGIV